MWLEGWQACICEDLIMYFIYFIYPDFLFTPGEQNENFLSFQNFE